MEINSSGSAILYLQLAINSSSQKKCLSGISQYFVWRLFGFSCRHSSPNQYCSVCTSSVDDRFTLSRSCNAITLNPPRQALSHLMCARRGGQSGVLDPQLALRKVLRWGFRTCSLADPAVLSHCLPAKLKTKTILPESFWLLWLFWHCKRLMYCMFSCPEATRLRQTITVPGLDL